MSRIAIILAHIAVVDALHVVVHGVVITTSMPLFFQAVRQFEDFCYLDTYHPHVEHAKSLIMEISVHVMLLAYELADFRGTPSRPMMACKKNVSL